MRPGRLSLRLQNGSLAVKPAETLLAFVPDAVQFLRSLEDMELSVRQEMLAQ